MEMKKIMLILALLVLGQTALARTGDDVVNEFRDEKHAEYVNIGPAMFQMAKIFGQGLPESAQHLTSVRVLDLSDCSSGARKKFEKRCKDLRDNGDYEELAVASRDASRSTVLVRSRDGIVTELVIFQAGGHKESIAVIRGQIPLSEVSEIAGDPSYDPIE